ncbi:MAG TPA: TetR/AcrR family transcriptional regulator [Baekduia sp.]|uniref:TetR/AcrR family transcriptional regulator n=1 Tax=Baekduia sp. TaxID=2600305 RepID=UPI002BF6BEBF|nr:TetR/AcrR family transcriptional regulator [Baekduia sp.]HMJ37744.1 TetR/AcrR family transcriptional regulator [Baekduia sp.]
MHDRRAAGGATTSEGQILEAALDVFAAKGYHGSTIREIAVRAGVSVAGLYHHFSSKRDLLERLMDDTMDGLLDQTERAVAGLDDAPVELLRATVGTHVRFHIDFQRQSFVGNTEIRSLDSPARERILVKRDRQRAHFEAAVAAGLRTGAFTTAHPAEATRALVTMCTAVAAWYRADRPLTPDQLVERYCDLALQMVVARHPHRARDRGSVISPNHS